MANDDDEEFGLGRWIPGNLRVGHVAAVYLAIGLLLPSFHALPERESDQHVSLIRMSGNRLLGQSGMDA